METDKSKWGSKTKELWKNPDYRKYMSDIHKGKTTSEKQKQKAREFMLKNNPMKNPEIAKMIGEMVGLRTLGKKHSEITKRKMSFSHPSEKCNFYIDGRSKEKGYANRLYGDDWFKIRELVLYRDNYSCRRCGKKQKLLHIHHIIPYLKSFDNSLNNLITLCPSCHRRVENGD